MATISTYATRRACVEASSRTLGELIERDAAAAALLEDDGPIPDRDGYLDIALNAVSAGGFPALRSEKRRRLLEIAARDLAGEASLEVVTAALADLADSCLEAALAHLGAPALSIIGMGKLGGRELNYVSDIDLVFVTTDDVGAATKSAAALVRELGQMSPQGHPFQIDLALRPEGRSGGLVRTLDAYLEYYKRWAKSWEFQAFIKARPAAGSRAVGDALVEAVRPLVFSSEVSSERIVNIRKMKERVEGRATRSRSGQSIDDVKLGPGGIRDIEFSVQLLQLVHGGADESVRSGTSLTALAALAKGGYVEDDDEATLAAAYRWLRHIEHRLQLWSERRTHLLPHDRAARARLARNLGFVDSPESAAEDAFHAAHRALLADVRGRFEKLFYRPMIESLADTPVRYEAGRAAPSGSVSGPAKPVPRLSREALEDRLRVLGFRDVGRAATTLGDLVVGSSRRATVLRVLTPAMLRWLAASPLPDGGLSAFLQLGEALESRPDVLGRFRDNPPGLAFLAAVLGSGRWPGETLAQVPEELRTIAEGGMTEGSTGGPWPKGRERVVTGAKRSLEWRTPERRLDGLRRFKRRELLEIVLADLSGTAGAEVVGTCLAELAEACLEAALEGGDGDLGVVGLGKLGGQELGYASDIDVMLVSASGAPSTDKIAVDLVKSIGEVTPEGQAFRIDLALRPEGKSGPLVRSLESCLEYYRRWAKPWELQALIKARPVAGDFDLASRLIAETRDLVFRKQRPESTFAELRHLKARMEKERIPRGSDARRHIKMGPGGMSDIEFAAQIMQLRHGHHYDGLRVTGTVAALEAAGAARLLPPGEAAIMTDAYRFLMRLRNRLFFMTGRAVDALPVKPEDLEALGAAMGYTEQPRQELEEAYLRTTRRARKIAEPLIYG